MVKWINWKDRKQTSPKMVDKAFYFGRNRYIHQKYDIGRSIESFKRYCQSRQEQADRQNHGDRRWIKVGTIFAVIASMATASAAVFAALSLEAANISAAEARRQADIAQNALIASNRPWIRSTGIKVDRLEVKKDQISVWLSVSLKNIGHSPALQVSVFPELVIPEIQLWNITEIRRICSHIASNPKLVFGNALFPDEEDTITVNFGRPMRDIVEARQGYILQTYQGWKAAWGQKEADEFLPQIEKMANFVGFGIIGCISYTFEGSAQPHGTGFAVQIQQANGHAEIRDGTRSQGFYMAEPNTVPESDITVTPGVLGKVVD